MAYSILSPTYLIAVATFNITTALIMASDHNILITIESDNSDEIEL